jgi:hypothetical protein
MPPSLPLFYCCCHHPLWSIPPSLQPPSPSPPSPLCPFPHHPPHALVICCCPQSWSCGQQCFLVSHRLPLRILLLVDCCLTHCCHWSANAIANVATNATAATRRPLKPPPTLHCCCFNRCRCAAGAAFTHQHLLFTMAACRVAYSCTASLSLNMVAPINAQLPPIHPVGFLCGCLL